MAISNFWDGLASKVKIALQCNGLTKNLITIMNWPRGVPMRAVIASIVALLVCTVAVSSLPSPSRWGVFEDAAERQWTTEREPRARVTRYRWEVPGRILIADHGFESRLQFGASKFADTVQRLVLDSKSGKISSTYTYEDGRPPLKSVIEIQPDGSAIETFTDATGKKKRNIYRSPASSVTLIERQELQGEKWSTLGVTRKAGVTESQLAEAAQRKAEAAALEVAERRARDQARLAEMEAQRAVAEAQAPYQEEPDYGPQPADSLMGKNILDVLNGMAADVAADTERSRQRMNDAISTGLAQQRAREAEAATERARAARAEVERIQAQSRPISSSPLPRRPAEPWSEVATTTHPQQCQMKATILDVGGSGADGAAAMAKMESNAGISCLDLRTGNKGYSLQNVSCSYNGFLKLQVCSARAVCNSGRDYCPRTSGVSPQ